jgi:hypothetical protein
VIPAVERAGLLLRDAEILSLHYAETTREWRRRFLANRERVLELYDERFLRMWEFYLAGSEASFRFDALHVAHLQLARDPDGPAPTSPMRCGTSPPPSRRSRTTPSSTTAPRRKTLPASAPLRIGRGRKSKDFKQVS